MPFWSIWGCPNAPKQHRKTVFWLFWTISSTRMSLLIWLGPYFQAKILGRASRPLGGLCKPFWVHLGVPKCPKIAQKSYFLVAPDHFFLKNRPKDMVRGLVSSLNIRTYTLPTCGSMCTCLSPFGDAQMPKNSIKKYFWVVLYYFSYKNGPNDLVRGLFSSWDIGTYIPPPCGPLSTFLSLFVGAQMPQNSKKKLFSGCFGLFLLYKWA